MHVHADYLRCNAVDSSAPDSRSLRSFVCIACVDSELGQKHGVRLLDHIQIVQKLVREYLRARIRRRNVAARRHVRWCVRLLDRCHPVRIGQRIDCIAAEATPHFAAVVCGCCRFDRRISIRTLTDGRVCGSRGGIARVAVDFHRRRRPNVTVRIARLMLLMWFRLQLVVLFR